MAKYNPDLAFSDSRDSYFGFSIDENEKKDSERIRNIKKGISICKNSTDSSMLRVGNIVKIKIDSLGSGYNDVPYRVYKVKEGKLMDDFRRSVFLEPLNDNTFNYKFTFDILDEELGKETLLETYKRSKNKDIESYHPEKHHESITPHRTSVEFFYSRGAHDIKVLSDIELCRMWGVESSKLIPYVI